MVNCGVNNAKCDDVRLAPFRQSQRRHIVRRFVYADVLFDGYLTTMMIIELACKARLTTRELDNSQLINYNQVLWAAWMDSVSRPMKYQEPEMKENDMQRQLPKKRTDSFLSVAVNIEQFAMELSWKCTGENLQTSLVVYMHIN